jgi:hypothetical protein
MGKKKESSSESSSSSSEEEKKNKKEKKVKVVKPKQVVASPQSFSKRYSSFYNNKHLSDFSITIGSETFPAHKIVLINHSDFFANMENESSFTFPKEDDETAAKSLLKFFYEGVYEYTEESAVVIFTLLANKVTFFVYL